MLFNSFDFLIFFPVVLIVYFLMPQKARRWILLVASYFFYMSWNPKYAVLIAFSTVSTWLAAIMIDRVREKEQTEQLKKGILTVGLLANLSILVYFKYTNFIVSNIYLFLNSMHITVRERYLDYLLPVGISFYTFQALSYLIDVYRDKIDAEKNLCQYALFVSFFPQLVAGPIERSTRLLKQIRNIESIQLWNTDRIVDGFKIMVYGYFLKMVVADRAALYVNEVFAHYSRYNSGVLICAVVLFAVQIYCDFNSYSLIAVGSAKILGFELLENFDAPYLSRSVTEFWRRWHISLNTWFIDYLYIPLGGNRCSAFRKNLNVMIVFLVSGLWHGANWTYILWGGINGLYQVIESSVKKYTNAFNQKIGTRTHSVSYKMFQTVRTFVLVDFAWIFFRSETVTDAFAMINRMFTRWDPWILFSDDVVKHILPDSVSRIEFNIMWLGILFVIMTDVIQYSRNRSLNEFLSYQCTWFRSGVYICLLLSIIVFGVYGSNYQSIDFIYFQF